MTVIRYDTKNTFKSCLRAPASEFFKRILGKNSSKQDVKSQPFSVEKDGNTGLKN